MLVEVLLLVAREFEVKMGEARGCKVVASAGLRVQHNIRNVRNESLKLDGRLHQDASV